MGFLSDLTDVLDPVSDLESIAAPIVGGILGSQGAQQQNSAAAASVQQQEDFQQKERLSTYPDTVKSLTDAGLNPMLAYTNGGLPVPSGSVYQPQNVGAAAVQGATQASNSASMARNLSVQSENIQSQSDLNRALIQKAGADTNNATATAANTRMDTMRGVLAMPATSANAQADASEARNRKAIADSPTFGAGADAVGKFMSSINPFHSAASLR